MFLDERWRLSSLNSNEHARGHLAKTKPMGEISYLLDSEDLPPFIFAFNLSCRRRGCNLYVLVGR